MNSIQTASLGFLRGAVKNIRVTAKQAGAVQAKPEVLKVRGTHKPKFVAAFGFKTTPEASEAVGRQLSKKGFTSILHDEGPRPFVTYEKDAVTKTVAARVVVKVSANQRRFTVRMVARNLS